MLCADLVGLQVSPWARAFYECCEWLGATVDRDQGAVEYRGRTSWVRTYPITIDQEELRERAAAEVAQTWARRFRDDAMKLLVRADRAEPSKNIVRGFEAWEMLLDRRPDLREGARFVACLYPSRESMDEYQSYVEKIESTVDRVNARHPGSIDYFLRDDYDRTLGALMSYDALLVNSIMDGMNLVSKEGPTINERSGVLVLTGGAGSFEELGEHAVSIEDPYDVEATADAIETALDMPREKRRERAESLRKVIESRGLNDWIEAQLDDLSEISEGGSPKTPPARTR
jgi:trehalose 6-phosphate synthase